MDMQALFGVLSLIIGAVLLLIPYVSSHQLGGWHIAVGVAALAIGALLFVQSRELKKRGGRAAPLRRP